MTWVVIYICFGAVVYIIFASFPLLGFFSAFGFCFGCLCFFLGFLVCFGCNGECLAMVVVYFFVWCFRLVYWVEFLFW